MTIDHTARPRPDSAPPRHATDRVQRAEPDGIGDGGACSHLDSADPGSVAAVAVVGGAVGLVSLAPGLPVPLVAILTATLTLLGPGGLVVAWLPAVPRSLALAAVPGLGLAILSLIAAAELAVGQFHARPTTGVVALVVVVGAAAAAWRRGRSPGRGHTPARGWRPAGVADGSPRTAVIVSLVAAVGAVACAATGSARLPSSVPTDLGPLVRVPELAAAAVLVAVSFGAALWARSLVAAWCALVLAVLVQRGATLLATETALYEWTYRHLGVIDWFVRVGHYERDVDVYNNWPAALALGAWFVDTTGMDPLALAHGFQLGFHLLLVPVVYALGRCAGLDRFGAVTGAFVVEVACWVAQDYLSPQAFAYLLAALAVAALLVTAADRYRVSGLVIGLTAASAVIWSHQLTPAWLLVVAGGLVALRLVRPWWVMLLLILLYLPSVVVNLELIVAQASTFTYNVFENTRGNVRTVGSPGQRVTSGLVKALAVILWAGAFVVVVLRRRGGGSWRRDGTLALAVIGFSPFVLLAASYGGEAVFRVFLFSLLGCGPLIGGALARMVQPGGGEADTAAADTGPGERSAARAVAATVTLAVIALMGLQGFLGGWYALRFTAEDVDTARRIEMNAGPTGAVVPIEYAYPLRSTWVYLPQARDDALAEARWDLHDAYVGTDGTDPGPAKEFTDLVADEAADRPVYVVVSEPIREFVDYFRIMDPGGVDRVVGHLRADGWDVVLRENGTVVLSNTVGRTTWR